jgi:hypothetical protein
MPCPFPKPKPKAQRQRATTADRRDYRATRNGFERRPPLAGTELRRQGFKQTALTAHRERAERCRIQAGIVKRSPAISAGFKLAHVIWYWASAGRSHAWGPAARSGASTASCRGVQ